MKIGTIITDVTHGGGMERVTSLLENTFIKRVTVQLPIFL